jgi:Polysaccharide biosynthesis enzyme WcbI
MTGRRIVVSSNCQTGGLMAALNAMLPDDSFAAVACAGETSSPGALRNAVHDCDVWVTALDAEATRDVLGAQDVTVIHVPMIFFRAFHPDTVWVGTPDGGWVRSPAGRTHSAIVVWGWQHGLSLEEIVACFRADVFEGLGYTTAWETEVQRLRGRMHDTSVAFEDFFLAVRRELPFMYTVNHPRLRVLVELARPVARILGADDANVAFPWDDVLPDALHESGPIWPVYPAIAEALGVRGGLVWRGWFGGLFRLEAFVAQSLHHLSTIEPATAVVPALADSRFDEMLDSRLVRP